MRHLMTAAVLATAAMAAPAAAQSYNFSYGFGTSTYASGVITTDATPVQSGAANVVNITGTRMGAAITGYDYYADSDQLIFPKGMPFVDQSGITYQVGAYSYNVFSIGGGFYTEFAYLTADPELPGTGTFLTNFTLTPVAAVAGAAPEPASWAMMILGFAVVGAGLRRQRSIRVAYSR